jgi:hypothetical protein
VFAVGDVLEHTGQEDCGGGDLIGSSETPARGRHRDHALDGVGHEVDQQRVDEPGGDR